MEESATYRAIVRRAHAVEARRILLLLGASKYGAADASMRDRVEAIDDVAELEGLTTHVLAAGSWAERLPAPTPQRAARWRSVSADSGDVGRSVGSAIRSLGASPPLR